MANMDYKDVVARTAGSASRFSVSDNIRRHGYAHAFMAVHSMLISMGINPECQTLDEEAIHRLEDAFTTAERCDLLGPGGVPHWNFLGLWMLNHLLAPVHYLESGYFRGSSLLAALGNEQLRRVNGFDPNPGNLALTDFPPRLSVKLDTRDFSEVAPSKIHGDGALVYFDDHINTAQRILEAHAKGYRRIVFDDSCGLTGMSQRHWPAMPTLYFIVHAEELRQGDYVEWPSPIGRSRDGLGGESQLRVTFDAELIDLCRQANAAIASCTKLPDLSDYVLWRSASAYPDLSQHLVVLKGS